MVWGWMMRVIVDVHRYPGGRCTSGTGVLHLWRHFQRPAGKHLQWTSSYVSAYYRALNRIELLYKFTTCTTSLSVMWLKSMTAIPLLLKHVNGLLFRNCALFSRTQWLSFYKNVYYTLNILKTQFVNINNRRKPYSKHHNSITYRQLQKIKAYRAYRERERHSVIVIS